MYDQCGLKFKVYIVMLNKTPGAGKDQDFWWDFDIQYSLFLCKMYVWGNSMVFTDKNHFYFHLMRSLAFYFTQLKSPFYVSLAASNVMEGTMITQRPLKGFYISHIMGV